MIQPYTLLGDDAALSVSNFSTNWIRLEPTYGDQFWVAPGSTAHFRWPMAFGTGFGFEADGIPYSVDVFPESHNVITITPIGWYGQVLHLPVYYFKWGFGVGVGFLGVVLLLALIRNMGRHSPEL